MPVYVDSNASGANDGTSWTDAYASIESAVSVAGGSEIWLAYNHSETTISTGLNFANAVRGSTIRVLSVDPGDDSLRSGAVCDSDATGFDIYGDLFFWGVSFIAQLDIRFHPSAGETIVLEQCVIEYVRNFLYGTGVNNTTILRGCTVTLSGSTAAKIETVSRGGRFFAYNTTFPTQTVNTYCFSLVPEGGPVECYDCDLSGFDYLFATSSESVSQPKIVRCKLKSGWGTTSSFGSQVAPAIVEACDDGTITMPPLGLTKYETYYGVVSSTTSVYRTGGADDGEQTNAHSWEMASNSNALELYNPVETRSLVIWTDPEVSPSGATARGIYTSTRCDPLATPAALTTDSGSTWNGVGVGTKQKIDHTLGNGETLTVYVASGGTLNNDDFWIEVCEPDQVGGPTTLRCFLAKPSTTVYVDPKLGGTRQYFSGEVQINEAGSGGGGIAKLIGFGGGLVG